MATTTDSQNTMKQQQSARASPHGYTVESTCHMPLQSYAEKTLIFELIDICGCTENEASQALTLSKGDLNEAVLQLTSASPCDEKVCLSNFRDEMLSELQDKLGCGLNCQANSEQSSRTASAPSDSVDSKHNSVLKSGPKPDKLPCAGMNCPFTEKHFPNPVIAQLGSLLDVQSYGVLQPASKLMFKLASVCLLLLSGQPLPHKFSSKHAKSGKDSHAGLLLAIARAAALNGFHISNVALRQSCPWVAVPARTFQNFGTMLRTLDVDCCEPKALEVVFKQMPCLDFLRICNVQVNPFKQPTLAWPSSLSAAAIPADILPMISVGTPPRLLLLFCQTALNKIHNFYKSLKVNLIHSVEELHLIDRCQSGSFTLRELFSKDGALAFTENTSLHRLLIHRGLFSPPFENCLLAVMTRLPYLEEVYLGYNDLRPEHERLDEVQKVRAICKDKAKMQQVALKRLFLEVPYHLIEPMKRNAALYSCLPELVIGNRSQYNLQFTRPSEPPVDWNWLCFGEGSPLTSVAHCGSSRFHSTDSLILKRDRPEIVS